VTTEVVFAHVPEDMRLFLFKDLDLLDVLSWSITSKSMMRIMNESHWWMRLLYDQAKLSRDTILRIDKTFIRQYKGWIYVMGSFYDMTRNLDPFGRHYFCPFCSKELGLQPQSKQDYLKNIPSITIQCQYCSCELQCHFSRVCVNCEWEKTTDKCSCGRPLCSDCYRSAEDQCKYCCTLCHICNYPKKTTCRRCLV